MPTVEELALRPVEAGHVKPVKIANPDSDPVNIQVPPGVVIPVSLASVETDIAVVDASISDVHAAAANAVATVGYAAVAGQHHVIGGIFWSYDGNPTGGNLQAQDAGGVVFETDITTSGAGFVQFIPPKRFAIGQAITISLAPGGAGVSGKVSVLSHWTALP